MKPDYLKIIAHSFPENLKTDISKIFCIIPMESKYTFDLISSDSYEVNVDEEKLKISIRIYNEPKEQDENQLTEKQKDILNFIYKRHNIIMDLLEKKD